VLAAVMGGMAVGMNVGKVPLALPGLRAELGLSLVQAGWVSAMLTTLAVVAALGFGLAAGRIGALRMVLGGLVLSAVASLAALTVHGNADFGRLLASRFVEGAGFLAVAVAAPTLVSAAAAPADRRFALSVWSTYMPAGAGLAMALSPGLLPTTGWRGLWALTAAVLLAAAAAAWWQRAHFATHHTAAGASGHATALRPTLVVLRQPLPWLLALAFGMWALQHFALIVWLPTFLKEQRGLSPGWVALLSCVMLLACVPGNLLGGVLMQRGVPRGRLIAAAHTLTGLCGLGFFSDSLPDGLRYALCVALSFIGGLIPAAVMSSSAVLARSPQQIGALQGLTMQGSQLGQCLGTPLIAAVVAATGDWASAAWVTTGAAVLGVALGLAAWRAERAGARD
jgi:cyanate permease